MKLSEARKESNEVTGRLSDVARQLLFAGVAIVWFFGSDSTQPVDRLEFEDDLRPVLLVLLVGLAFDFLQYAIQGIGVRLTYRAKDAEYRGQQEALAAQGKDYRDLEVRFPDWIPQWSQRMFLVKLWCLVIAYGWLILTVLVELL